MTFPSGSKPYMLRVTPDGRHVWVQTGAANTNVVLDAGTMETLVVEPTGKGPVQSAFGPANGDYGLITHLDEPFVLVLDRESGRAVTRIDVGAPQANASFTADGATAFVTVPTRDEVVAIDMAELTVVGRVTAGDEPMGVVVFDPVAG